MTSAIDKYLVWFNVPVTFCNRSVPGVLISAGLSCCLDAQFSPQCPASLFHIGMKWIPALGERASAAHGAHCLFPLSTLPRFVSSPWPNVQPLSAGLLKVDRETETEKDWGSGPRHGLLWQAVCDVVVESRLVAVGAPLRTAGTHQRRQRCR